MEETRTPPSKPRALIVDDEPDMLDFIQRVLRRRFDVTTTSSAEDAINYLTDGDYELLITDHQMPRVSGLELLAQVRGVAPGLVRIIISGFAEAPETHRAVESGELHNSILKPVDSQKLLHAIEHAYRIRDAAG